MILRPTLAQAARRHVALIVVCTVVGAASAVAIGWSRTPTYAADVDLIIGKVDPQIGAVSGYLTTTQGFAKGYTRAARSQPVVAAAARRTGLTPDQIRDRTSTSFSEKTPTLRITTTGNSRREATELASALGEGVTREINRINRPVPSASATLAEFRRTANRSEALRAQARDLQEQVNQQAVPSPALDERLGGVRADAETTRLRSEVLRQAYRDARAGAARNFVRVLARPRDAIDDRARVLEFLAYVGAIAGLLVGLGIAWQRSATKLTVPEVQARGRA